VTTVTTESELGSGAILLVLLLILDTAVVRTSRMP
jgi:hypothetical protein